ncbi:MAG: endonuclease III [Ruminococcaceae bacterium]|nr:endonuclease III [Oscillospiraceae bacterium]
MTKKERARECIERLKKIYPDAICSLEYENPLELLIATRLSAQCTDARVNMVTPVLFSKYKTLDDYANADVKDIESIIHSCGFYHGKARDIIAIATKIRDEFDGKVPDTIEELTSLQGVGRKTANLIVGDVYHKPTVVTDTHLIRITNRIGLAETKDPYKLEMALKKILPPEESNNFCHRIVLFGRDTCSARNPKCDGCPLSDICKKIM